MRVLDLSSGVTDTVTRLFADLGADVLKVEPPGGSPARHDLPALAGVSIPFAVHNANKRSVVLDPDDDNDRRSFFELVGGADIVVDGGPGGQAGAFGTSCAELADRYPHLVALSITDFGTTGPRSSWCATDPVLFAMSGSLSRSGPTTGTPVLPPDGIATATAAVQADLGRTRRLLQPITLRHRRLHRLLPLRRRRDGARPGVRRARAGQRRAAHQPVAGPPEEPGPLPDLSVQGRLRPGVRVGAAAVARPAPLAGRAGRISGSRLRRARGPFRRVATAQRAGRCVVRR